jgi:ABC-2 type transport system permease protein
MTIDTQSYTPRATLTVRVELVRQLRRVRTIAVFAVMVALPLVVTAAVKWGGSSRGVGDGDFDLVGLATAGPWNFTLTMLLFTSGFLLGILAAMFLGDTVASEASWSTLRYLLAAPVPRRRFVRAKIIVGLLLTGAAVLVLVIVSFVIALVVFGSAPLVNPLGGSFDAATSWQRLAIVAAYIVIQLLVPAGIAFLMTVLTDVPLGAVGAAVLLLILMGILDQIDALGDLRRFFPTHYSNSWVDALGETILWNDMAIGASYAVAFFAVFVAIAVLRFDRKDITS